MYANPHADIDPKSALCLLVEPGDLAGDLQTRQHRSARIVLMRCGVTEYRQKSVALLRADMAFESIYRRIDLFAVAAHQHPVRFGFHPRRQPRRIDKVSENYCHPADLTTIGGRGQQILSISVHAVGGYHPLGQRRGGHPITSVDRGHCLIEQVRQRPRGGLPRRWWEADLGERGTEKCLDVAVKGSDQPGRLPFDQRD